MFTERGKLIGEIESEGTKSTAKKLEPALMWLGGDCQFERLGGSRSPLAEERAYVNRLVVDLRIRQHDAWPEENL